MVFSAQSDISIVVEYDGDSFNGEEEFDILDPTPTAWNGLSVRPGSSDRQARPSQRSFLDSPSVREAPPSLQTRLRALPQFAPAALTRDLLTPAALIRASSPSFSLETPERSVARRPLTTPGVRPGPEGVGDVRSVRAQVGRDDEDSPQEMVTIIDAAGATIVAPVVQEVSNNNARVNKTRKKKVFILQCSVRSSFIYFRRLILRLDPGTMLSCWSCRDP